MTLSGNLRLWGQKSCQASREGRKLVLHLAPSATWKRVVIPSAGSLGTAVIRRDKVTIRVLLLSLSLSLLWISDVETTEKVVVVYRLRWQGLPWCVHFSAGSTMSPSFRNSSSLPNTGLCGTHYRCVIELIQDYHLLKILLSSSSVHDASSWSPRAVPPLVYWWLSCCCQSSVPWFTFPGPLPSQSLSPKAVAVTSAMLSCCFHDHLSGLFVCFTQSSLSTLLWRLQTHRLFKATLLLLTFNFAVLSSQSPRYRKVLLPWNSVGFHWTQQKPSFLWTVHEYWKIIFIRY